MNQNISFTELKGLIILDLIDTYRETNFISKIFSKLIYRKNK